MRDQLKNLLNNFSPDQMSVLSGIAQRVAEARLARFTGKIVFEVAHNMGDVIDARVSRTEKIRVAKK